LVAAEQLPDTPAPRRRVDDDDWELLTKLADEAEVSPQVALGGILDFILADPARHRAAERFLKARAQLTSHEEPKGAARR
jgi:hypothetical protein